MEITGRAMMTHAKCCDKIGVNLRACDGELTFRVKGVWLKGGLALQFANKGHAGRLTPELRARFEDEAKELMEQLKMPVTNVEWIRSKRSPTKHLIRRLILEKPFRLKNGLTASVSLPYLIPELKAIPGLKKTAPSGSYAVQFQFDPPVYGLLPPHDLLEFLQACRRNVEDALPHIRTHVYLHKILNDPLRRAIDFAIAWNVSPEVALLVSGGRRG